MKIYNKKSFANGILDLTICILGIVALIVKGFTLKLSIPVLLLLLFSITSLKRSFSRTASVEDIIKDTDERDKYILLKTSHKSMQILEYINFIVAITFMIIYAITKNNVCLGAFIISGSYITIGFIVTLITNIYYEKHE